MAKNRLRYNIKTIPLKMKPPVRPKVEGELLHAYAIAQTSSEQEQNISVNSVNVTLCKMSIRANDYADDTFTPKNYLFMRYCTDADAVIFYIDPTDSLSINNVFDEWIPLAKQHNQKMGANYFLIESSEQPNEHRKISLEDLRVKANENGLILVNESDKNKLDEIVATALLKNTTASTYTTEKKIKMGLAITCVVLLMVALVLMPILPIVPALILGGVAIFLPIVIGIGFYIKNRLTEYTSDAAQSTSQPSNSDKPSGPSNPTHGYLNGKMSTVEKSTDEPQPISSIKATDEPAHHQPTMIEQNPSPTGTDETAFKPN